jgi:hypothetical protein
MHAAEITRTYECVCGHSERINVAMIVKAHTSDGFAGFHARPKIVYENDCSLTFANGSSNQALDSPGDKEPS